MSRAITIEKQNENQYQVLVNDNPIKNHADRTYPLLSENIARNLTEDLNSIYDKNRTYSNKDEELLFSQFTSELTGDALRESFAYCLISTMMEYEIHQVKPEINDYLVEALQYDRVYRLNPGPPWSLIELRKISKIQNILGDIWKDHSLNSEEDEISSDIVDTIISQIHDVHSSKLVAINILNHYFGEFSITASIFWVLGKITNEDYIQMYYTFHHLIDLDVADEETYEKARFLMNRLLYLKTILWGYDWKDETLPLNS